MSLRGGERTFVKVQGNEGQTYEFAGLLRSVSMSHPGGGGGEMEISLDDPDSHWLRSDDGLLGGRELTMRRGRSGKAKKTTKEKKMNKYEVTIVSQPLTKSQNIYVQVLHPKGDWSHDQEIYLTADGTEAARAEGEEMPLYKSMPNELFEPLAAAVSRH
jgi:hypothetical protein